ncbi:carbohydrate binding protein with CBM9 domain [Tenacibaculum skagerrakense]|uniref:Carbohydrate binding protein with CBM9 domain n=2 Tax=Tenacibaculum skagerrakense TaxID=186571 RepID=A0A4R2NZ27_9FLAO|nr:carbohydrate binding protein with CBM9 domain [Tenacibaculum skagerrakense]
MRIGKMKQILNIIFTLIPIILFTQEAVINYKEGVIDIDGKLDEEVWNFLPIHTNFYNVLPTDEGLAENQTEVKIFHNGEFLYIGAIYNDTTSKQQVSTLKRDVSIGISDAFVVVLDTQNQQQNGNLFAVNTYGTQVDALVVRNETGYGLNFNWNAVWETKTSVQGTKKVYEIAIPFKALNFTKENSTFGVQFYVRDIKNNSWTILTDLSRNYVTFDLRFTKPFSVEKVPEAVRSRFAVSPSLTIDYQNTGENNKATLKPSLDVQYNLTSSLKLDATLNPDFSQIDVDQQVTNLSRFSLFFPERRNFFLENADLFSNLGTPDVNPFYSRRVGANSNIQFGVKLSGNVYQKTRVGVLNVQTEKDNEVKAQNFSVLVAEQQLSKQLTTTAFLVNKQETDGFSFVNDYNRVTGMNLNFKSNNKKWIGTANWAMSLTDNVVGDNHFFNMGLDYNDRGLQGSFSVKNVQQNYLVETGFTPRLYTYDAINDEVVREGYFQAVSSLRYTKFYNNSKTLNSIRYLNYSNNSYFDVNGTVNQMSHYLNSAVFFKDLSSVYYAINYDDIDLKYGFNILGNGNVLTPGNYENWNLKIGYNSANNQQLRYQVNIQKGKFYNGDKLAGGAYLNYQLLPFASFEFSHDINSINLNELGKETFHLSRFTGEVFFNNRLNWTTYVQYNNQLNNFNINSRIQWEYKPLSYLYFVITDNFDKYFSRKNWGVAFKMNYRFDF